MAASHRKGRPTHGESGTRLHRIWKGVKGRCQGSAGEFKLYGARGITCSYDWQTYEPFRNWALANGYHDARQLDRIDADGPYSPENCRWVAPIINNARKELPRDGSYLKELTGRLTQVEVDSATCADQAFKLWDGDGLHLLVSETGHKVWRLKYRFGSRERLLTFGPAAQLTLAEARELRAVAQSRIARGVNPRRVQLESEAKAHRRQQSRGKARKSGGKPTLRSAEIRA